MYLLGILSGVFDEFSLACEFTDAIAVENVPKNKITDKLKIFVLCVLSKFKSIGKLKPRRSEFLIEKSDKIVNGIDELISKTQNEVKNSFAIELTADFQEWRIYSYPNYFKTHTYGIYNNNKKLVALIVFNSNHNDVAYVCQSTFHPELTSPEKVRSLKSVTGMLFKEGIALVRTWLFDSNPINANEISIYNEAGYVNLDRGIGLVWKPLDNIDLKPEDFILSRIASQGTS